MNKNTEAGIFILIPDILIGVSGYLASSLYLWKTTVHKDKEISFGNLL
jgi:hypothetical protein